jgi:Apoptosis inhibitory protein 5 (API5)
VQAQMILIVEHFQIRRLSIKELPNFCKDSKENTPKISDILAQLLISTDALEIITVNGALASLSKVNKTIIFVEIALILICFPSNRRSTHSELAQDCSAKYHKAMSRQD